MSNQKSNHGRFYYVQSTDNMLYLESSPVQNIGEGRIIIFFRKQTVQERTKKQITVISNLPFCSGFAPFFIKLN
jgi:hypothetical protein